MTIFLKWKRNIIIGCLVISFVIGSWYLGKEAAADEHVMAQESLSMYSGSYALMDADACRVLIGKEENTPMANASTTKILTCIVTLENCSLDETVLVSANAASQPKVRYGIKEGEQYVLKEMLYGLMLESYNDCAVAIAEHVAGSEAEFARMLNQKAKEIGCTDTYFITPNGLDEENEEGFHHTTAEDLCRMMSYCVWKSPQKETFLEITQTRTYGPFVNRNAFLDQMDGVLSGKTGFTAKAGYCYVAALEQNGERYTIALLACGWPNNKTYKWHDAKELFTYGLENYDVREITLQDVAAENAVEELVVDGYINIPDFVHINQNSVLHLEAENRSYRFLMSVKEQLRKESVIYENIELPIEKGTVLGEYQLYLGEEKVDVVPLFARESGDMWSLSVIAKVIFYKFFELAI